MKKSVNLIDKFKQALAKAAKIKNRAERSVTVAAIVGEALRSIQEEPVLVGGAAVEFFTQGGYTTGDIDMLAHGGPALKKLMTDLGFENHGKDFVNEKLKIYIEFPGSALGPQEEAVKVQLGSLYLWMISIEDLIVDRLSAYKFWKSGIDGLNSLKLLETGEPDLDRLARRAREEHVLDALEAVQQVLEEVIRKKLSHPAANRLLENRMRELSPNQN